MNRSLSFIERVSLFVAALRKAEAAELLGGLASSQRSAARQFCRSWSRCDSATRQARLTSEFGGQPDAVDRLHALLVSSPPQLGAALWEVLPPQWRPVLPQPQIAAAALAPALRSRAARLIQESL